MTYAEYNDLIRDVFQSRLFSWNHLMEIIFEIEQHRNLLSVDGVSGKHRFVFTR